MGYAQEPRQKINEFFQKNPTLRRAIQKIVLFDISNDKNIWERSLILRDRSQHLSLTSEDIIAMLAYLDQSDNRCKELIQCVAHNEEMGKDVREAAKAFFTGDPEMSQWLSNLAKPEKAEWKIKNEIEQKRRLEERENKLARTRTAYREHLEDMRNGDSNWLTNPAKAYLKCFYDISNEAPPDERIALWLNKEIANAAHQGFEKVLLTIPTAPSSDDIVLSLLEQKYWLSGYIFIAALAERLRKNIGFGDLSDEQLTVSLFHLEYLSVEHQAGIQGLEKFVRVEIQKRGLWLKTIQKYLEPQLKANLEHINSFDSFIDDPETINSAAELLLEWLNNIPNLSIRAEIKIIDCLLHSKQKNKLKKFVALRRSSTNTELKRTWE
ncbi:MAG: hypothetical protein EOO46_24220, partial [Flavobacterium sp.]